MTGSDSSNIQPGSNFLKRCTEEEHSGWGLPSDSQIRAGYQSNLQTAESPPSIA